ncbi:MAG TPA: FAD:protein FMN transferase [Treponemataceae bacterium]|nr:FAD:protein FMN transferase [Treponemataceae bacterium]
MDTVCSVSLYEPYPDELFEEIFTRLQTIENNVSAHIESSDVSKINKAAGTVDSANNKAVTLVHDDTIVILQAAIKYAQLSDGAFDPSIGPLVELWGLGTEKAGVPTKQKIQEAIGLVDYTKIEIDTAVKSVYLSRKGMGIDLGGIAKGYAADTVVEFLQKNNVERAIIDLGGNIYAYGAKKVAANGKIPWNIGIKNPMDSAKEPIIALDIVNKSLVTSGIYERFLIKDNIRYHHLFNAKTGYPVNNGLVSTTIISKYSIEADALSTAVFVMGYETGARLLDSIDGVDGIFIDETKKIRATSGIRSSIALNDDSFRFD